MLTLQLQLTVKGFQGLQKDQSTQLIKSSLEVSLPTLKHINMLREGSHKLECTARIPLA